MNCIQIVKVKQSSHRQNFRASRFNSSWGITGLQHHRKSNNRSETFKSNSTLLKTWNKPKFKIKPDYLALDKVSDSTQNKQQKKKKQPFFCKLNCYYMWSWITFSFVGGLHKTEAHNYQIAKKILKKYMKKQHVIDLVSLQIFLN